MPRQLHCGMSLHHADIIMLLCSANIITFHSIMLMLLCYIMLMYVDKYAWCVYVYMYVLTSIFM